MGGKSKTEQTTTSNTQPWAPAIPVLRDILSGVQGQAGNYQPNALEQGAIDQLTQNSQNLPNFAPQATNLANSYMGGDPTGLLNPALSQYQNTLNPIANAPLDPTKTPGIQNVLNTIRGDVSRSVNQQFAGAGRDLSGLNAEYLARGIASGEAVPLLNQYNQNVQNTMGAAGGLYKAAGNTENALTGNQGQAFNFANMIPGLQNASPLGVLSAQQQGRQLPIENLGMLANLTVPIAGLGSQGYSHSLGYNTASPAQTAAMWGQALGGSGGMMGAAGKTLGLLSMFG